MEKYIGKEQALMQLTGRFPKDMSLEKYIGLVTCRINELATTDVIPIPDQTTNGDMFMSMFPDAEVVEVKYFDGIVSHYQVNFGKINGNQNMVNFKSDWWNAPYKREVEE